MNNGLQPITRTSVLAAGLLAVAACSGSSPDQSPPVETDTPATTAELAPTRSPVTTTTIAPITEPLSTDPVDTVDPDVVAEIDAVVAEAFVDYDETWDLLRAAFEDPDNPELRETISEAHIDGSEADAIAALNRFVDDGHVSLPPTDDDQEVTILRSVGAVAGVNAFFQACETFTAQIVDAATGSNVYDGVDSYLIEVEMRFSENSWRIVRVTTIEEFKGTSCE